MKPLALTALAASLVLAPGLLESVELPQVPTPAKEHKWLEQLVGKWESSSEALVVPGQPPVKGTSTESVRMLGGFWLVSEGAGQMTGLPGTVHSMLTLGFDPAQNKFVGTWIDSMSSHLWKYTGSLNAAGNALTLETEGPCPTKPGQTSKFREVIEIKNKDHRTFTSSMLGDDGKWSTFVTVVSKRKG